MCQIRSDERDCCVLRCVRSAYEGSEERAKRLAISLWDSLMSEHQPRPGPDRRRHSSGGLGGSRRKPREKKTWMDYINLTTGVVSAICAIIALVVGLVAAKVFTGPSKTPHRNTTQHATVRCSASYPLALQIPPKTGAHVGVTVEAVCAVPVGLTYLVIETIPNVDPDNPHPAYFVKATIPHLKIGQTTSKNFLLKEPIGTKAEFWVISVDNGGLRALSQNQVVDNGILFLPSGTIQESPVYWHTKGWQ